MRACAPTDSASGPGRYLGVLGVDPLDPGQDRPVFGCRSGGSGRRGMGDSPHLNGSALQGCWAEWKAAMIIVLISRVAV